MRITSFLAIAAGVSTFASAGHAGIILGWHNPSAGSADFAPDFVVSPFESSVIKYVGAAAGSEALGDGDTSYGNFAGTPAALNGDGRINLQNNGSIELWVSNSSPTSGFNISNLYYDWRTNVQGIANADALVTSFKADVFSADPFVTFAGGQTTTGSTAWQSTGTDIGSLNFFVAPNTTAVFKFTNTTSTGSLEFRLDNIALSVVPEVGTVAVLGGLLGVGFFMRNRPRIAKVQS